MGNKWITKEEVEAIIKSYKETEAKDGRGSILKTAETLKISTVKVRRVLITEELWSSRSSKEIGKCRAAGMSTAEIAEKLHMTEKNVQAYMPYEGGVYGEESQNAVDSRRSRDKARGKDNSESQENTEGAGTMETNQNGAKSIKESDAHYIMRYAVESGKMAILLDEHCDKVNGLSVVRESTIEYVKDYEKELYMQWEEKRKEAEPVKLPDPFDYPLEDVSDFYCDMKAAEEIEEQNRKNNPFMGFVYIDCAPGALDYASPGMPEQDYWLYPGYSKINEKSRKQKKLTYSQFIDRLSVCVCGQSVSGTAYEKILKTQIEVLGRRNGDRTVLVFVNAHLLCDRSGGKYSKYTSVGDMIGTIRQIWDSTGTTVIFVSSNEMMDVLGKDDEGKKLNSRLLGARV